MVEANHEYWARRAAEESSLAQNTSGTEAAYIHRALAKAYLARIETPSLRQASRVESRPFVSPRPRIVQ